MYTTKKTTFMAVTLLSKSVTNSIFAHLLSLECCFKSTSYSCFHTNQSLLTTKKKIRYSEEILAERFVDEKLLYLYGGNGGDGASIFHRDRISAYGGPSGGSGGKGGDIILRANKRITSLYDVKKHYRAKKGGDGRANFQNGKFAKSLFVDLPVGTRLICEETNKILTDLKSDNETYLACIGGNGGKGNMYFKSSTNQKPSECTKGETGEARQIRAELLLIADAGLVGFPNVGKSTLLSGLSRASPLIGEYAFTTLSPHIGVIKYEDFTNLAVADLPGLVKNAHLNEGLGFKFLKHVERCRFLVFVCDMTKKEPWTQVKKLSYELKMYNNDLPKRASIVVANKMDVLEARTNYAKFKKEILKIDSKFSVIPVSAKNKINIEELICELKKNYQKFDVDLPLWT